MAITTLPNKKQDLQKTCFHSVCYRALNMEKIKVEHFQVTVTYKVGLGDLEIPKNVYDQLVEVDQNSDTIDPSWMKYPEAADWLSNNIKEGDCMQWEVEIDDLS